MDFAKLRNKQKGNNTFADLAARAESGGFEKDPRFLVPKVDKDGNGFVILRFLPHAEIDGDDYPDYVTIYKHGFEGTGGWYIENSRTTLKKAGEKYGEIDPVSEANREVYATLGKEEAKEFLRSAKRNRQTKMIANVLVLKNAAEPDTVGKQYLFEFGTKILDKIIAKTKKDLEDDIVFDAFNMWEGANFRLKMKKVDGQRNYDDSSFDQPSSLFGGDETKLENVYNSLYSLSAEISPDKFKSYEELEKRFLQVTQGIKQKTAENTDVAPKDQPIETVTKSTQTFTTRSVPPKEEVKKSAYFDDEIPF